MRVLILPGMDGFGVGLDEFIEALRSASFAPELVKYDHTTLQGYDELLPLVSARLAASNAPTAIVAESFSGPLAIRLSAEPSPNLRATVLVATFASSPLPRWIRHFAKSWVFAKPPPKLAIDQLLLGGSDERELSAMLQAATAQISPQVFAKRVNEVFAVDVRRKLAALPLPLLYLQAGSDRLVGDIRKSATLPAQARWHSLAGPHLLLETNPSASAALITAFLKEVCGETG